MRDNHPRRRQARRADQKVARAKASRQGLPIVLIICEGTETEPNYLAGLCEARRINPVNLRIESGGTATDALSLVKRARNRFLKDRDYDQVYVILDDDGQPLEQAKRLAAGQLRTLSGNTITVELIINRPAFEFWLLLHFEYSARPFADATSATHALCAHLTDYRKEDRRIFAQTSEGLEKAIHHAESLRRELVKTGASSPSTNMDKLMRQLLAMSRGA